MGKLLCLSVDGGGDDGDDEDGWAQAMPVLVRDPDDSLAAEVTGHDSCRRIAGDAAGDTENPDEADAAGDAALDDDTVGELLVRCALDRKEPSGRAGPARLRCCS